MHKDLGKDDRFQHRQAEHEHFMFEDVVFPATKEELVDVATESEFDVDRLNLVRALPERDYLSRDDVWRALGEASRRFGLGRRDAGTARDDLGKQASHETADHVDHP